MRVKTLILATSAAGALALSAGAASADPNGWYGAIDAGYHMAEAETSAGFDVEIDDDWAGFARLGYRFTPNWRVELEGGYRPGEIGEMAVGDVPAICNAIPAVGPCENPEGDLTSTSLMMNVIYDFGSADSTLRPFIGLGAGLNRVNTEYLGTLAFDRTVGVGADDSSSELAAQALAGLTWALSDRASMDLTYRYLMSNFSFETFASAPVGDFGPVDGRYTDHSISLGLRYAFGADEPVTYVP